MRRVLLLLRHSLARQRGLLVAAGSLFFGFQILLILVARGLERSGGFLQLEGLIPDFLEQWSNMAALTFAGMVAFGYSHPVMLVFLVAIAIAIGTEPAGEIESGFVDLLMARSLPRGVPVLRSLSLLLVVIVGSVGCMLLGTWTGLRLLAPDSTLAPEARVILALAANLVLIVAAWGALALALGAFARRRATAAAVTGLLALAMFILDYVGRLWQPAAQVSRLSPFHYFSPFPLIGGAPLPAGDVGALLAIVLAASAVAYLGYARRDL